MKIYKSHVCLYYCDFCS